ncbi:MAG: hypothetical protein ACRD2M_02190 [Terriglobales bacterium]
MNRAIAVVAVLAGFLLALPWAAAQEATFANVPLIDTMCSAKAAANPDAHTRACALQCQSSGFGILTEKNEFLKLDAAGNSRTIELLKSSSKQDKLRVSVSGTRKGTTLEVKEIKLL